MKYILLFIVSVVLVACSSTNPENAETDVEAASEAKDSDVVAIVKGKEITLKKVRALHSVEEKNIPLLVDMYIQDEIMVLEAKTRGIDVSDDIESIETIFPFGSTGNEDYFETQAEYLGITAEEYYEVYFKERMERDAYINRLMEDQFDMENVEEVPSEARDKELNDFVSSLWKKYKKDIEIRL
ncbi:hypothetical protein B0H99_10125 [Planomicrobium soli]|uniref:SurA-like protein n=1 Tax=Planomicrobium soli TaxID=1176648 RepID=A0A2P8H6D3_9BACL|nr:hypothetical protein [Planomicrobium soli]PSL41782.1 hypothetical protein B0H99_10125 [Planomicrobium soli]